MFTVMHHGCLTHYFHFFPNYHRPIEQAHPTGLGHLGLEINVTINKNHEKHNTLVFQRDSHITSQFLLCERGKGCARHQHQQQDFI
jgi:hypothetical protein